jgi:Protein kinase domain
MEYRWRADASAARIDRPGPLLEHYLERFPELGPVERIPADLIGEEYRLRRRQGERLAHPEFLARFPGRDTELSPLLDSIDTELSVERSAAARFGPPREPLEPAAQGSRFQVVRPHLRGGLGQIFIARDLELDREVALKEIHDFHADRADSRARFIREAEITGRLEHPGIVPVYGMGRNSDGRPFYAMRLIRGDTLGDAIHRYHKQDTPASAAPERALELRRLLGHFITVCNTIAYAHSQGVLHRDIKPSNILLGPFGQTVVVDWGLPN